MTLFRSCPRIRWAVWTNSQFIIAGIYIEPSVTLFHYEATLAGFRRAIILPSQHSRRCSADIGDFNRRMGVLTGDHASSARLDSKMNFTSDLGLMIVKDGAASNNASIYLRESFWAERGGFGDSQHHRSAMYDHPSCTNIKPLQLVIAAIPDSAKPPRHATKPLELCPKIVCRRDVENYHVMACARHARDRGVLEAGRRFS